MQNIGKMNSRTPTIEMLWELQALPPHTHAHVHMQKEEGKPEKAMRIKMLSYTKHGVTAMTNKSRLSMVLTRISFIVIPFIHHHHPTFLTDTLFHYSRNDETRSYRLWEDFHSRYKRTRLNTVGVLSHPNSKSAYSLHIIMATHFIKNPKVQHCCCC